MNLVISLMLSASLQQPVIVPGCCPLTNWVAVPLVTHLVPVLLVRVPPRPEKPQERLPHAAYL